MSGTERRIKILGVGRYLPRRVVSASEAEALCDIPEGTSSQANGVFERRWADVQGGETAPWMGAQAANEALQDAGVSAGDLDLIINASGSHGQMIPDGSCYFQRELGLQDSGIKCMTVHSTCLSFITAIDVAAAFIATGQHEKVLIVSSDVASVGLNKEEAESFTLFGDIAAAAVVVPTPDGEDSKLHRLLFETYSSGADLTVLRGCGSTRHPNSPHTAQEDNYFSMNGPEVLKMAVDLMPPFLARLCPPHEPRVELVIPHQTSKTGLKVAAKILEQYAGIGSEQMVNIVANYGNCVGSSIPSTLYEAVKTGRLQRGTRMMMVGTGAGLSLGGAVMTY